MLDKKLNLKDGNTIAIIDNPYEIDISAPRDATDAADAIMVFAVNKDALDANLQLLITSARREILVWLAYPKAKQLNTDLNRDIIWSYVRTFGLDPVRQVAIDDTWSALRLKLL